MDISDTLAPKSDQLDAVDLQSGPRIFTVKSVTKGDAEQPVQVHLVEFPRGPWRPGKNMRRVLAACWGADASAWAGRRVELYCDPAVRFGPDVVGGTRIRSLSHIDKAQTVPLIVSRGKGGSITVQPLKIEAPARSGDAPEPEPLLAAVNRQVNDIIAEGGTSFLKTFCGDQDPPIAASSKAIVEAFGERARNLRALMGDPS